MSFLFATVAAFALCLAIEFGLGDLPERGLRERARGSEVRVAGAAGHRDLRVVRAALVRTR